MQGYVYLIGAGPGDPNLITLRGTQCLRKADVVLYDGLINPQLLQHAPQADHVCVGKHGHLPVWTQSQIQDEMIRLAKLGKTVARLKGGDPAVFARAAEEAAVLIDNEIPYETVPGITAALAAASYAGVPITHRDHASAVALVTGHQQDNGANDLDWNVLAQFPGTLVVYMGVTTAPAWTEALLSGGMAPETPVALIRRCTWSDQQVVRCPLVDVADRLSQGDKLRPPVIAIIGKVANLTDTIAWFDRRPLFGQRVLVTRAEDQAKELAVPLEELGAEVICHPVIEVGPPETWDDVDQSIQQLPSTDWLVFCSRNGLAAYINRMSSLGYDARRLASCQIAAVGRRTADALAEFSLRADLVPPEFHAESLLQAMSTDPHGAKIVVVRANRGRDILTRGLTDLGADVTEVQAYRSCDVASADPQVTQMMQAGEIHWTTVTSSAIGASLVNLFGDDLRNSKLACLSPITSKTVTDLFHQPACEAKVHTMLGLVEAIKDASLS